MALLGTITRNLAPMFSDKKGLHIPKIWLCFAGRRDTGAVTIYSPDADEVQYDIVRGKRQISKLVKRSEVTNRLIGPNQKNMGLGSFTEVSRGFPLSIEEFDIQKSKLRQRIPGEANVNSGYTEQDRMLHWAGKAQQYLLAKQGALGNYLCGQAIRLGEMESVIGTTEASEKYDFYRDSDLIDTTTSWATPSTAVPLDNIDTGIDKVMSLSGVMPDFALIGDVAIVRMQKSDQVQNLADNRGFTGFIRFGSEGATSCPAKFNFMVNAGWECRGKVTTFKGRSVWVFTSEELQADPAGGDDIRCMDSNTMVLGSTQSPVDQYFGPSETYDETEGDRRNYREWFGFMPGVTPTGQPDVTDGSVVKPDMFYLDAYRNEQKTATTIRSQYAPLFTPKNTDSWATWTNL